MLRFPRRPARNLALSALASLPLAASCAGTPQPGPETPASPGTRTPFYAEGADTLDSEASVSGMLGVSDPINPRDGSPYRAYRMQLTEGDVLHVHARSSEFWPGVAILGPDGTLVGATQPEGSGSGQSRLVRRISAGGDYILVISGEAGGTYGAFDVTTELIDPEPEVSLPGQVEGFLYASGRLHPKTEAPMTVYPLELEEDTAIDIALRSQDFDAYLTVVEAGSERVLSENDDAGAAAGTNSRVIAELPAGSYEIWATALRAEDADGRYTLSLGRAEIEISEAFAVGELYKGFLGLERQAVPGASRQGQALEFEVDEPVILRATMRANGLDPYLVLNDDAGRSLAEDDDSGGERDARVLHPLQPGRYVLWASSYGPNESGPYQIETSLLEGSDETSISVGGSVEAVLTQGDEVFPARGSHIRYYDLKIEESQTVRIDMRSQDFDTYLVLEGDVGDVIAENDDAQPGTTDAQITRRLDPGTYRIGATSYPPAGSGAFTLEARRTGGRSR